MNNESQKKKHLELKNIITAYHNVIKFGNPNAKIVDVDTLTRESQKGHHFYSWFKLYYYKIYLPINYTQILNFSSQHFYYKCS